MIPINKRQLEVEKAKLAAEAKELKHLKGIYKKASDDISEKIRISNGKINVLLKDFDKLNETERSILQSQIYQRNFQQSLKKQIDAFTKELESKQYESVNAYLKNCYTTGFTGTLYDLAGQGVPFVFPIDQKKVTKAMVHDTKLSKPLYNRLGEDVNLLKKRIANNISRGIATADSYVNIARNIANGTKISINNTMRIARTEGHRIQCAAAYDVQHEAQDAGADIVKQWDATLDGHTRETHAMCDGEIVELDETFSNGLEYPGDPAGDAEEVINCRCALLQRAKWALDEDELQMLKDRAEYFGLDKSKNFEEFRQNYIAAGKEMEYNGVIASDNSTFDGTISKQIGMNKSYRDVLNQRYSNGLTEAQKAFNKFVPADSVADSSFSGIAHFSPSTKKINMDFATDLVNKRGAGVTFFHEHGHYIDFMAVGSENYGYLSVKEKKFGDLLRSDFKDYVKSYKKQHGLKAAEAYKAISIELIGHEKHSLSDLLDGISKGKCCGMYGHKRKYWTQPGALEKEAFAHMFEASFDSNKYALMKQYFPNALAEFERLLKGVI